MAAAANYGRPKPVDPLWYVRHCYLRVQCGCGRQSSELVSELLARHRLPRDMLCYQLIARLRCSSCGNRPNADVGLKALTR